MKKKLFLIILIVLSVFFVKNTKFENNNIKDNSFLYIFKNSTVKAQPSCPMEIGEPCTPFEPDPGDDYPLPDGSFSYSGLSFASMDEFFEAFWAVLGHAWSENTGWISFSCIDHLSCETSNYGVYIDKVTGEFSGYAWSENIGWISFNKDDDNCNFEGVRFTSTPGEVTGFAKVLSYKFSGGCLKLNGIVQDTAEPYGVSMDSHGKFHGWAWSEDVLGWVSFNCDNTGAANCEQSKYEVFLFDGNVINNTAPEAKMSCDIVDCAGSGCECNGTWETYNQGGDSSNAIYTIINESIDPDPGDSIAASNWKLRDAVSRAVVFQMDCPGACIFTIQDTDPGNYNIELKVTDQRGKSATTSHPIKIKQEAIAAFECCLSYSENPDDWKTCDDAEFKNKMPGTVIYLKDDLPDLHLHSIASDGGSFIVNRTWTLNGIVQAENNSTSSIVLSKSLNSIKLTITDDQTEARTAALDISIQTLIPAPPVWKEVSPVSFAEKILAFVSRIFRV